VECWTSLAGQLTGPSCGRHTGNATLIILFKKSSLTVLVACALSVCVLSFSFPPIYVHCSHPSVAEPYGFDAAPERKGKIVRLRLPFLSVGLCYAKLINLCTLNRLRLLQEN
jgi:hypothetical protein